MQQNSAVIRSLVMASIMAATAACGQTALVPGASTLPEAKTNGGGTATPDCRLPEGWAQIAQRDPRFVVFGEIHGTKEAPAFFGNVACSLAAQGERILVAVELSATLDADFQAAWRLPAAQSADALRKIGWAGREDGVSSKAMFNMLVRLHAMKEQGYAIGIVTFNGARDEAQRARFSALPGQGPHEAAQAENIRDAAAARPYDRILVLVGNFHARMRPVDWGGLVFKPMVMQLAEPENIVALEMQTAGGTAWDCGLKPGVVVQPGEPITDDAIECGSHPHAGQADLDRPPFVSLTPFPNASKDEDYDGFFWLGKVSASPPAVVEH